MSDQTESRYCKLLAYASDIVRDAIDAIRALEAKVRDSDGALVFAQEANNVLRATIAILRADVENLRADRDRLTSELSAIRAERSTFDCRYAGQYWEASGSHCPIDRPCVRCQRDRLRDEYDILECNLANDGVLSLSEAVVRLTAELAEARKDVARVDWLATYPREATHETDDGPAARVMFWGVSAHPSISLREAIDAARSDGGEA